MESIVSELFTNADVVLLVVALNALGFILKRVPAMPSKHVPAVLAVAGVLGYQGSAGWSVRNALVGVVCAAAAIGGHRLVKDYLASPKEKANETPTSNTGTPAGPTG